MIVVSDANILIDFFGIGQLSALLKLGTIEVLDLVADELRDIPELTAEGFTVVPTTDTFKKTAFDNQAYGLSLADTACLHYCQHFKRMLLSNDKALRQSCKKHHVQVHGTLWVILELQSKEIPREELSVWLTQMENTGSRFPDAEVAKVRQLLEGRPSSSS